MTSNLKTSHLTYCQTNWCTPQTCFLSAGNLSHKARTGGWNRSVQNSVPCNGLALNVYDMEFSYFFVWSVFFCFEQPSCLVSQTLRECIGHSKYNTWVKVHHRGTEAEQLNALTASLPQSPFEPEDVHIVFIAFLLSKRVRNKQHMIKVYRSAIPWLHFTLP